jgi:hypothetical protein
LIVLRDGRDLKTLADARVLIFALPERHHAQGDAYFIRNCAAQLKRALKADGLI